MRFMRIFFALLFAVPVLVAPPLASPQSTTGSISGHVTDTTGAIIPAAAVTITNVDKGLETHLTSNGAGEYTALALPPGRYTVSVSKDGFNVENTSPFTRREAGSETIE